LFPPRTISCSYPQRHLHFHFHFHLHGVHLLLQNTTTHHFHFQNSSPLPPPSINNLSPFPTSSTVAASPHRPLPMFLRQLLSQIPKSLIQLSPSSQPMASPTLKYVLSSQGNPSYSYAKTPISYFYQSFNFYFSDIVRIVNANPKFFLRSLHDHIITTYHFVRGFLKSDKQTITCINCYISESLRRIESNVKLLLDNGVSHSNIARLLHRRHNILCFHHLWNTVEELKQLGFNASTSPFSVAFLAKRTINKAKWDHKVETFKKWSWSDQHILQAFKKQPSCMLLSVHKINAIMTFWVHHLGLDSLDLARAPGILKGSLEKTIIPRASVVQFLVSKGLRRKDASIYLPFVVSEKVFLKKFVNGFEEYSSDLLKLYEEKMNLADSRNGLQPGVNQVDQVLG